MEVHAPHHPVLTLREALVHLAIVTVGILIALSFDGVRGWFEHRSQVAEARHALLEEVRGNKEMLEKKFLPGVENARKENRKISALAQRLADQEKILELEWSSNYPLTRLQSASFATVQATGTLALMDYEEAKRFSSVYRLQETFERQHEAGLADEGRAFSMGIMLSNTVEKARAKVNPADAREWQRLTAQLDTAILIQSQIGQELDDAYASLLGVKSAAPGTAR